MTSTFSIAPAQGKLFFIVLPVALLLIGLIILFGYVGYSSRHLRFDVDNHALHIRGDLYGRDIDLSSLDLDRAKIVDLGREPDLRPTLRTNGTALPGYRSGWFQLRNGEKALLFVTDQSRVVYVPTTEGFSLLMSVPEPQAFLDSLKQHAARM